MKRKTLIILTSLDIEDDVEMRLSIIKINKLPLELKLFKRRNDIESFINVIVDNLFKEDIIIVTAGDDECKKLSELGYKYIFTSYRENELHKKPYPNSVQILMNSNITDMILKLFKDNTWDTMAISSHRR